MEIISSNKMSLFFGFFLALILPSIAQNSAQDYLSVHNAARAQVGVGPLYWSPAMASYAQGYANSRNGDCTRLVLSNGPYGESQAMGIKDTFSGVDASTRWVNQKQDYDYATNTCAYGKMCTGYTQVVWRSSTVVGCGCAPCNTGGWLVICSYNPPGNIIGQRPF